MKTKTIYFIRHGQSLANASTSVNTHKLEFVDTKLSRKGILQAIELSSLLKSIIDIEIIITSPLTRAIQTANHVFPKKKIFVDSKLRETYWDMMECRVLPNSRIDLTLQEILPDVIIDESSIKLLDDRLDKFWQIEDEWNLLSEYAYDEIYNRSREATAGIFPMLMARNETIIAVVAHSGVLLSLLQVDARNCGTYRVTLQQVENSESSNIILKSIEQLHSNGIFELLRS